MKKILSIIFVLFTLAIVLAGLAGVIVAEKMQSEPLSLTEPMQLTIVSGDNITEVANRLAEQGVLDSPVLFNGYAKLKDQRNIKAGCYEIQPGMTADKLLAVLNKGDVIEYKVTLVEGRNFREIRQKLSQTPHLQQTIVDKNDSEIMQALGQPNQHPEGRFFPATYNFGCTTSDLDILRQAHKKMSDTLQTVWAKRVAGLPYKNATEALTMASIIEKETAVGAERRQISGVFVRRLNIGMKLQTDPTIIYGMGERYQGNITRADIREATPYNTYVIKGLPPTPIAMPGLAALQAAVNPAGGDALYFVARKDGTHQFSATYAEHQAAVRKYQLGQ